MSYLSGRNLSSPIKLSDFTPETDHEIKNLKKTVQEVKSLNGKCFLSTSKIDAAKRESLLLDALSKEFETAKTLL